LLTHFGFHACNLAQSVISVIHAVIHGYQLL
jgi:hypothetical protein